MKAHPYAGLVPEMSSDDFATLKVDIQQNGLEFPITVLDGQILDGRARWRACIELSIQPRTVVRQGGPLSVLKFVVSANVHRRHLTKSQIAAIVGVPYYEEVRKIVAAEKAERNRATMMGNRNAKREAPATGATRLSPRDRDRDTAVKVAADLGIGVSALKDAIKIKKEDPQLFEEIVEGRTTADAAAKKVRFTAAEANRILKEKGDSKDTRQEIFSKFYAENKEPHFTKPTFEDEMAAEADPPEADFRLTEFYTHVDNTCASIRKATKNLDILFDMCKTLENMPDTVTERFQRVLRACMYFNSMVPDLSKMGIDQTKTRRRIIDQ